MFRFDSGPTQHVRLRFKVKRYSSPETVILELRGVACHMASYSVTCHPTQVHTHRRNHRWTGWYTIYLYSEGWKADWHRWPVTYRDGLPMHRRSPI